VTHTTAQLHTQIVSALRQIYDPELPVNIYDLGLIYAIDHDPVTGTKVTMTLTSPGCPAAEILPQYVQQAVESIPDTGTVSIELVWDPPWDWEQLPDHVKLELGVM